MLATWINHRCLPMLRLGLMVFLSLFLFACSEKKPEVHFNATVLDNPQFARDFKLLDANGNAHTLHDWRGKVVILFFGYTQCPDVCPTALARAAEVMQLLGKDAERVQVLFATVDPERDTPELLKEYVPAFHPSFLGLYTTPEETKKLAKEFRVFYQKNPGKTPSSYSIDHSVFSYVYDPAGKLRLSVAHELPADALAADLRQLLAGH